MFRMISLCETKAYNIYCPTEEAISRIEGHQAKRHRYEQVRFGGYKALLRSPANGNREPNLVVMMESALLCKVYQQQSCTKHQCGDYIYGQNKTDN